MQLYMVRHVVVGQSRNALIMSTLVPTTTNSVDVAGLVVLFCEKVKLLDDFTLNSALTMDVTEVYWSCSRNCA